MKPAGKAASAAAAYLAALTPASFRDVRTKDKDIVAALVKVGDALPAAKLRAVLDLLIDNVKSHVLFEALAQRPLPERAW